MNADNKITTILGVSFVSLLVISVLVGGVFIGRGCKPVPYHIDTGIDAGPGLAEIDEEEAEQLRVIEVKRREQIEALEAQQREEYEEVRRRGPKAVIDWLNEFDRERFGAP